LIPLQLDDLFIPVFREVSASRLGAT